MAFSRIHVLRLLPGMELKSALQGFVREKGLQAAFIITCVGSLTQVRLRLAQQEKGNEIRFYKQHFEIVSLVGTVSSHGEHLHISLSDAQGNTIGGHLMSDALVFTTAEIVIGEMVGYSFKRERCSKSGWPELVVEATGESTSVRSSKPAARL